MHREDQFELVATATKIEQQAKQLLARDASTWQTATLQHILFLVRYMKEHLDMLRDGARQEWADDRTVAEREHEPEIRAARVYRGPGPIAGTDC